MNWFALELCLFEEGFSLNVFRWFIRLRFLNRWRYEPHEIMESWGFKFFERSIHFNWGPHCKIVHLPWEFDHVKTEVLRPDGTWVPYVGSWEIGPLRIVNDRGATLGGKEPDGRWQETYDYTYTLKSGEVQHRKATIYVERMEWRWRCLKWLPLFAKKRQSITVEFDAEVGERTGSWKGGVMGTGYTMLPGESPLETLRRMELEHRM